MPVILTKKSDTPGSVPSTANLTNLAGGAELAVNTSDKRLFSMNSSSAIIEVGTNPSSLTCADASFTVARVGSLTISSLSLTNATVTSATVTTLTATSANITTLTSASTTISTTLALSGGTANGVLYLNGSKVATSGSALVFDASNVRLGIGTASPAAPVHVSKSVVSGEVNFLTENTVSSQYGSANFAAKNDTGVTALFGIQNSARLTYGVMTASSAGLYTANAAGLYLLVDAAGSIRFATNGGTECARIASDGKVGIGTTSPASTLQVGTKTSSTVSDVSTIFSAGGASASGGKLYAATFCNTVAGANNNEVLISFTPASNASATGAIGTIFTNSSNGESAMKFYTYGASDGLAERARITAGGQFFINSTTDTSGAGARLNVQGNTSQTAVSIRAGTNGTPGLYFTNSSGTKVGDIVINSGSTSYSTSGGNMLVGTTTNNTSGGILQVSNGITFPATQVAISDANTLDDYEEGTWTPADTSGAGLTFSAAAGRYTKIGNRIIFGFRVDFPSTANTTGAKISLPFTAANITDGPQGGGALRYTDYSAYLTFPVIANESNTAVYTFNGAVVTNATLSGKRIDVWGEYEV